MDDDPSVLARYARGFGPGRAVHLTTDPAAARDFVRTTPCDLAVVELRIGAESGLELARALRERCPGLRVAVCSGYLTVDIAVAALRAGVDVVLFKPVTAREILQRLGHGDDHGDEHGDEVDARAPDADETPTLERAEWEHIARVLADCEGNISLAARRLGIYRSSLQRRLRKLTSRHRREACRPGRRAGPPAGTAADRATER